MARVHNVISAGFVNNCEQKIRNKKATKYQQHTKKSHTIKVLLKRRKARIIPYKSPRNVTITLRDYRHAWTDQNSLTGKGGNE